MYRHTVGLHAQLDTIGLPRGLEFGYQRSISSAKTVIAQFGLTFSVQPAISAVGGISFGAFQRAVRHARPVCARQPGIVLSRKVASTIARHSSAATVVAGAAVAIFAGRWRAGGIAGVTQIELHFLTLNDLVSAIGVQRFSFLGTPLARVVPALSALACCCVLAFCYVSTSLGLQDLDNQVV